MKWPHPAPLPKLKVLKARQRRRKVTRVELFEQIRLDFYRRGKKIRAIARERRVGRKTVRAALASARPPDRRVPERERSVFTDAHRRLVDEWRLARHRRREEFLDGRWVVIAQRQRRNRGE